MKVLVTGASGFIGTALVDCLARKSHEITCLIRDDKKRPKLNHGVDFVIADVGFERLSIWMCCQKCND